MNYESRKLCVWCESVNHDEMNVIPYFLFFMRGFDVLFQLETVHFSSISRKSIILN